jgi:hypothetical protein
MPFGAKLWVCFKHTWAPDRRGEMVRQKGSTGHRVPVIDLSGDETLERSGAAPAVSGSTDMEARPEMEETQLLESVLGASGHF